MYLKKLKLTLSLLICSSFVFAGLKNNNIENIDENNCLDKNACPKILEISLVNTVKKSSSINKQSNNISVQNIEVAFPLLIKNKSKRSITTVITANYNNSKVNCGRFIIPGNSSIIGDLLCNVEGIPYNLQDSDGRSNTLLISDAGQDSAPEPESCVGKSINTRCLGGIIFETDGVNGLIVSEKSDEAQRTWFPLGSIDENLGTGVNRNEGATNTDIINAKYASTMLQYAAGYCSSLDNGPWYLPADNELNSLYLVIGILTETSFENSEYWSSTECFGNGTDNGGTGGQDCLPGEEDSSARLQDFFGGDRAADLKGFPHFVRCIKAF